MGLILDTTNFISAERRGLNAFRALQEIRGRTSETDFGISAITLAELRHGVERAVTDAQRRVRARFLEDVMKSTSIFPMTAEIALRIGMVDAELTRTGNRIGVPDLIIACTALELDFAVATDNLRHFQRVPGLRIEILA